MREIKFRGFTVNEEKFNNGKDGWIYGNLSVLDDGTVYIQDINDKNWFKAIDPESVGQYTGLKDKNGKEIYEGDIVAIEFQRATKSKNALVEYSEKYATFIITHTKEIKHENENLGDYQMQNFEVIGNIYDNPELLEK